MTSYVLDGSVVRVGGGRVLVGGSPLKLFRLTAAGAQLIDRIGQGEQPVAVDTSAGSAVSRLIDRLLDTGVIHPVPAADTPLLAVTVVIPAYGAGTEELERLVAGCGAAETIVIVDDASPVPIAPVAGATLIRHERNRGPGAARNTGAALVTTPLVVFIDTDVVLPGPHPTNGRGWLDPLVAHFADERVALVAPRVSSVPGDSLIERYEQLHSPLDLGDRPGPIKAGSRISYVPSAVVVVRVDDFRVVGGFDETMRLGEDVDLVWRLAAAGHRLRFEPTSVVSHSARRGLAAASRQRFGYGSSAAPLARRHRGAVAPVRVSGWSAAAWATTVAGWPVVGGSIAAITTALLARKLRDVPDGPRLALRLAGLGHLFAGRSLASGVTRAWWPLALAGALVSKRCRRIVVLAALAPPSIDWLRKRPPLSLPTYVAMRVADDMAYGAGLWTGVASERSLDALTPDLTSWPGRRRAAAE